MKIPDEVFEKIKKRLWTQADRDGWISLSARQKTNFYEHWSTDKEVGMVLGQYMEKAQVRVYLKDTIMKPYNRSRTSDVVPILKAAGLAGDELSLKEYVKPHGRLLFGNRVVCWGKAQEWKPILVAVYERAFRTAGKPYAAVLLRSVGKMAQPNERALVQDMAKRLGIEHVLWPD